ncbi:MAG: pyridoxamine 5-phosphate oxidase [Microvirga sp.]|jgi:PPOX class probable FMN-dependent enzyme|nr:pyridoxamine 5-phosphate oxidase [Microvirga sp.]
MKHTLTTLAELETIYGEPSEAALVKVTDRIVAPYRRLIEASPFFVLATNGSHGLDCSPRGDAAGFVRVADERTLLIPDRRGNNRIDSLRNIVRDPRVALLFLIPGVGETLRVRGRAAISVEPTLIESFVTEGKPPRSVVVVTAEAVYFQCQKAIVRSDLWNPEKRADRKSLPSAGQILAAITENRLGGEAYDAAYPERMKATLW